MIKSAGEEMATMITNPTKWSAFGTSIFAVMTQKAHATQAINLAQGFPDFDGPDVIKQAACRAILAGHNQYAPMPGLPQLRERLAERQAKKYGLRYHSDSEVTIYSGATEAIFCSMQALFDRGDEILALEPFYDSYAAAAFAAGAKLVGIPLVTPEFRLDPTQLEAAWTPRTKAILINTPHNPTGHVLSEVEAQAIRSFVLRHDLLLITDEVYEEIIFPPHQHINLASLPNMRERTIVISSTSKTFSMTGWKIGYCFAPESLTRAMRAVHQFTVFCSATPLQHAMIAAIELEEHFYSELRATYLSRRDLLSEVLRSAGFKLNDTQGSYFILADYSAISDVEDIEFCEWLIREYKVAAIPISVFYADAQQAAKSLRYVRFAFCKEESTLLEAGQRLIQLQR